VTLDSLSTEPAGPLLQGGTVEVPLDRDAVRRLVDEHYAFIWRLLARLGVRPEDVDDATQQVFMVPMTRESLTIQPGRERSFLFGVALRVASEHRRRNEKNAARDDIDLESFVDPDIDVEALADQQRARVLLDGLVARIPEELRMVFILFEIEGLSAVECASLLGIPPGTVASRLRRARQHFHECVQQMNIPGTSRGLR
jgi:RNA polymerase sigma-70 factor (ECF subfamily)